MPVNLAESRPDGEATLQWFSGAQAVEHTAPQQDESGANADFSTRAEDVSLRLYDKLDDARADLDLLQSAGAQTAFQNFLWLNAWQRHIGERRGVVPAIVIGRGRDGAVIFALAFGIETRGAIRRLTWLGTDQCDYNGPTLSQAFPQYIAPDEFAALWERILTLLQTQSGHPIDVVDLAKMPEEVGAQANPMLALRTSPNPSGAYITKLGSDWEDFYKEKRSSQTRKKERRQLKHLAEFGEVRYVDVQDVEERRQTLELLFTQKSRALARMGAKDIFAAEDHRAFYADVLTRPGSHDLVHVSRLDIGSTIAAITVGLTANGRYYLILSSYDDGDVSKYGPGRALLHELLQYAIAHRFDCFDFTIGDEPYKMDWCDKRLVLHDHLAALTARGHIAVALATGLRATKRFIKQTPILWRAFSKARTFAAPFGVKMTHSPKSADRGPPPPSHDEA
jgi:CelD/BcsL family acetyltransferase involved in cellulose biosynthesis